jgi:endonuclease III
MKSSNQYIQRLKKLFSVLKKGGEKPKKPAYQDPVEAIVFAVLSENSTEASVKTALKKIQSHFVDFNDMRVARTEEIVEVIGPDIAEAEKCSVRLTSILNAIFQKYDCLTLEDFTNTGKKVAKELLGKFNGMTSFVSNYIMLTVINAHAVPLTEKMIQYLKAYNIVDPESDNEQIVAFVEKLISAANSYAFYALVRHDSELVSPKAAQLLAENKPKSAAQKKPKAKK